MLQKKNRLLFANRLLGSVVFKGVAPISQLSYKVQITVIFRYVVSKGVEIIFSPGRQAEAKQSTRGSVCVCVCVSVCS